MAKKIFKEEEYELQDGTVVTVRPLPIKPLRTFMQEWQKLNELGTESTEVDFVDQLLECAHVVVSSLNKEVEKEQLEESLDMDTMQEIIKLGGGVMMSGNEDDPKVVTA